MGVQLDRVVLLLAVLNRHARAAAPPLAALLSCDVFVNVAGGLRVTDPASDLAVGEGRAGRPCYSALLPRAVAICSPDAPNFVNVAALAIASSALGRPLPPEAIFLGEVGLHGEVRVVAGLSQRVAAASQLGFQRVFARMEKPIQGTIRMYGMEVICVSTLAEAVASVFGIFDAPVRRRNVGTPAALPRHERYATSGDEYESEADQPLTTRRRVRDDVR